MLPRTRRTSFDHTMMIPSPSRFARDVWLRSAPVNHRFDKLGNALPLELHGCGCGLCARQQRALRKFWEAR